MHLASKINCGDGGRAGSIICGEGWRRGGGGVEDWGWEEHGLPVQGPRACSERRPPELL